MASRHELTAAIKDGKLSGWHEQIAGLDKNYRPGQHFGAHNFPANFVANYQVDYAPIEDHNIPTGALRAPYHNANGTVDSAFMDEVAEAMGKDQPTLAWNFWARILRTLNIRDMAGLLFPEKK